MRFDSLLIAFLMIALFSYGGAVMIGDMNSKYAFAGVNISQDEFSDVYDSTDDVYEISQQAYNQTLVGEIEGGTSTIESMIKGSYSAIRLVGSTFGFFRNISSALAEQFNIPEEIITIAWAIFIISIIFSLIYLIFRFIQN